MNHDEPISPATPPPDTQAPGGKEAPLATARVAFWRRLLAEQPLALQCALIGVLTTAIVAVWVPAAAGAERLWWAVLAGLVVTVALSLLARLTSRALRGLTDEARLLIREGPDGEGNFSPLGPNHEIQRLALALRRLVHDRRRQLRAMQEHNQTLGEKLALRSLELHSLEDLSIGLGQKSRVSDLVDEALDALGQTIESTSASIWARQERRPGSPVRLLGCRSDELDNKQLEQLAGARLSRSNVALFEEIERSGLAVIEPRARRSMLSWLWGLLSDDTQSSSLYRATRSWMALPLLAQQEVIGVLRVDHHEVDYFDTTRQRLLRAVANQTGLAMRHAELLTREREMAVLAERNRIARDLHDAVSQTLFAATMIAGAMVRNAESGVVNDPVAAAVQAAAQAGALERLNRAALAELRLLMFELRPDALERTDLADLLAHAVDALASRGATRVATDFERGVPLDGAVRVQLYRIAQEALSNIAKHSQAASASVSWRRQADGSALLRIADDGVGFEPAMVEAGHFGVQNIQQRAAEVGLVATIDTTPGGGAAWSVRVVVAPPLVLAPRTSAPPPIPATPAATAPAPAPEHATAPQTAPMETRP